VPDDLLFGCAEPFRPAQVSFNVVNQIGRLPVRRWCRLSRLFEGISPCIFLAFPRVSCLVMQTARADCAYNANISMLYGG
jgi:hypothetical protein